MKKICRHCGDEFKTDSPKAEFCKSMACQGERILRANEKKITREKNRRSARLYWAGKTGKDRSPHRCLKCDRLQELRICKKCQKENAKIEG